MNKLSMKSLLAPQKIAVVGASPRGGRGADVMANLRQAGFTGEIFGINPRYQEVNGYPCVPRAGDLPPGVDCIVVAVGADAACDVLEDAHSSGIPAAVVLAAGFGEGGHGEARVARLKALAAKGLCMCGPNCFGLINVKDRVAAYSGPIPRPLRAGPVAIVSQSGGLGATVFAPLMTGRHLGFSYFVSSGNQLGATIEDYVDYFVDDPDVHVIAIVIEALKNPQKLIAAAHRANIARKTLLLYQAGSSTKGHELIRSHTGALASNSQVLAAFLRRCGIVQATAFDEFVEAVEMFAHAPRDPNIADDVVVLSGSGGGAAVASDALEEAGTAVAEFEPQTKERLRAVQPDFASVTNPIDGTGAMYDDPTLMPKVLDVLTAESRRPVIAASVAIRAGANEGSRRLAGAVADAARASGRTLVAYQYTALGGALDAELLAGFHAAHVPVLLGTATTMRALRYLPIRRRYWSRAAAAATAAAAPVSGAADFGSGDDFLKLRRALTGHGIPIVDAVAAHSGTEAAAALSRFGVPVAIKAEAPGLIHKSDVGCVRLGCATPADAAAAYAEIIRNAGQAGFPTTTVIVQPMTAGVAEAYAGVIDDPLFGPAVCFGLGGIFVEIFKDVRTEMAPLSRDQALDMIHSIKGAPILAGARGRQKGDVDALADLLVRLGQFAAAHAGCFRALDLNPIIVKPPGQGVIAVDIALDPNPPDQTQALAAAVAS